MSEEFRRLALVGYPPDYFFDFAAALERSGIDVCWVHATHSATVNQRRRDRGSVENILDVSVSFSPGSFSEQRRVEVLSKLECFGVKINDIILMDRVLRKRNYEVALDYVTHMAVVLEAFFLSREIKVVSSGRDSALQLMAMLVCRKLNLLWVVPTRMRIPKEMFFFTSGHETDRMIDIRSVSEQDREWARNFHSNFIELPEQPLLKAAAAEFSDVVRLLPRHVRLFLDLLKNSLVNRGNNFSRYTIPQIIYLYVRRRLNMIAYYTRRPYKSIGDSRFFLYNLHTQPESSIDVACSFFSDQIATITSIARATPITHLLYVKIHPTDVDGQAFQFYSEISKIPGVRLIGHAENSKELSCNADLIFVLTGTVGYESALRGKNVISFGKNYYNDLPTVTYCSALPDLPKVIEALLDKAPPEDWRERTIDFLAKMRSRSFVGEFNRIWQRDSGVLSAEDNKMAVKAYVALFDLLKAQRVEGSQETKECLPVMKAASR